MDRKEMMNALETIRKACTGRCEECKFGTNDGIPSQEPYEIVVRLTNGNTATYQRVE
jgi:hypothetical protein